MGTKGAKKADWETPATLREKAAAFEAAAAQLRSIAERMDRRRVRRIYVFRSPAVAKALKRMIPTFLLSADAKATDAGA